jgi:hypothetical protein
MRTLLVTVGNRPPIGGARNVSYTSTALYPIGFTPVQGGMKVSRAVRVILGEAARPQLSGV